MDHQPIEIVNQREPIQVTGQRLPLETTHVYKEKEHVEKPKEHDSYINMPFLESTILQDSNSLWVKIPGVTVGESSKFGHKSVECSKIWELLDTVVSDSSVAVINFNEKAGVAFLKTGFNVKEEGDCVKNEKYTAFILKSKLTGNPFK